MVEEHELFPLIIEFEGWDTFLSETEISYTHSLGISGSHLTGAQENRDASLRVSACGKKAGRVSANEIGDSRDNSSVSEQIACVETGLIGQNDASSRKRKSVQRGKPKETPASTVTKDANVVASENSESNAKRSKSEDGNANQKQSNDNNSKPLEAPKDYIHVTAKRVRREKISERMKFLQDLVPGCSKETGKAVMLDEIISYTQSLQRQVEFLSMKLSIVNSRMDINMEALMSKDMFQSRGSLKRNLKSFKFASGQQLGEHLLKTVRYGHEIDKMKNFEREQNIIGTNSNEVNKSDKSKTSFHISYKDLELHFGKRLEDAANDLGVSRSTLKRARKECGITRWPSNVKNKENPSLFQTKTSNKQVQNLGQQLSKASSSNLPISDYPIESNVPQTCIETTREVDKACQENNVVTIKAKFKEDIVKFDLCFSSGLEKLVEEVSKRLHLMRGNFKLKYKDDDDDLILLTCDEDLHYHVKRMGSLGKTTVHVLVHLVSE